MLDIDPTILLAAGIPELIGEFVKFVLNIDEVLFDLVRQFGPLTYLILFTIIFCETGLVVTPVLPGDSLLFAAGAIAGAAGGGLNIVNLLILLSIAAVLGDAVNYSIGYFMGPKVLTGKSRFLKREYIERTHVFFLKYGKKTIVLARFVPIVRTFAPFLAGVGQMPYTQFAAYNIIGGVLWVSICTIAGYLLGGIPLIKKNFEWVIIVIVIVSVLPMVFEVYRGWREGKQR